MLCLLDSEEWLHTASWLAEGRYLQRINQYTVTFSGFRRFYIKLFEVGFQIRSYFSSMHLAFNLSLSLPLFDVCEQHGLKKVLPH